MDMVIRKATKADMPQVLELIKELAVFEREPDAVEVTVEELQKDGFGADPMFTCFVAEFLSEIIGMALVYFRYSTWKGRTIHLEDLVVKERMRGKGAGNALYTEVIKYSYDQGVKRVNWVVLGWNKGAIQFYERSGATIMDEWWQVEMDAAGIENFIENN